MKSSFYGNRKFHIYISMYINNVIVEFKLNISTSQRDHVNVICTTTTQVFFYLRLRHKALYYGLNIILPVIVLSFLTTLVFLLPPDSGEKIGYCLTLLLTFMVILTLIATELPTIANSTSILRESLLYTFR